MRSFSGVLLKPIDQQADRDGAVIDPAGVKFDPDEWVPIWRDFSYNVPEDWLGRGRVSREADGSLIVTGEMVDSVPLSPKEDLPWKLAIGAMADDYSVTDGVMTVRACRLVSISFAAEHQDPTQPPIVIGATIRRAPMNLVRLGHYFNPGNDGCQTALVVKVVEQAKHAIDSVVNLKVWDGDGDETKRLGVRENTNPTTIDTEASFHLSTNCPWGR